MVKEANMCIDEILLLVREIRKKKTPYYSNYYNQCSKLKNKFQVKYNENALAFIWNDLGIDRVYFFASDINELAEILTEVDINSVIDFITKDKDALVDCFARAGFKLHLEYGRFFIKSGNEEVAELQHSLEDDKDSQKIFNLPYGELAKEDDAEEIDKHLRRVFDPYEAHFYSIDTLKENIRKGWVWVAKENGKIIAGSCFEIQGKKVYGAYIWNDGDVEVLCSLNHKISQYLASKDVSYYYCWMRLNNKRVIRYNMKYNGYVPDGLYDMIFVKK